MARSDRDPGARASKVVIPLVLALMAALVTAQAQQDLAGFPKTCTNDQLGAPIFFDFDGDGVDELLHANGDHTVNIYTSGGFSLPGWPVTAGWHTFNMTPAAGDLDGDGSFEVVTATSNRQVHAYHANGTVVAGFPRNMGAEMSGACCLADLDDDGDMEIIVQPRNNRIYAIQGDGSDLPGWPVTISINEGGSQTPAVADLDGDGTVEVVTTSQGIGSLLSVFRSNGSEYPGFPITVTYTVGSPVIANLDRDDDLEIIYTVGSDVAARHHDGSLVAGFPVDCGSWTLYTSPAVGDIDRDGQLEIVFGSQDDRVYVVSHDGLFEAGWPSALTTGSIHGSPALVDLDHDGDLEILVAAPTTGSGRIYGWHHDGSDVNGFPWTKPSSFYGGVTLGDLDDDGLLDLAASGRSGACLYAWGTKFDYDATRVVHGAYRVNRHNNAVHNLHPTDAQVAVDLEMPASAAAGSTITLLLHATNDTTGGSQLIGGLQAEALAGNRINLLGPVNLSLAPGQSLTKPFKLNLPPATPAGGYRFILFFHDGAGHVLHWDGELLTVN